MAYFHDTREFLAAQKGLIRGRVLDFGSGGGKNRALLTPMEGEYIAFDLKPPQDGVPGDVHSAPFPNGSFDVVACNQVLEHVQRPRVVAEEIFRLLRPGGTCMATAPFMFPYHADPGDYFRYTQSGLSEIFQDMSFTVIDTGTIGGPASVIAESIRMTIANPYHGKSSAMRRRIVRYIDAVARRVNQLWKSKIIYANSYVIVTK